MRWSTRVSSTGAPPRCVAAAEAPADHHDSVRASLVHHAEHMAAVSTRRADLGTQLPMSLREAWADVRDAAERAARFGRTRNGPGGEIIGWWPSKPGEDAADAEHRVTWLRHELFDPLNERELATLEREVERPIPEVLRRFYTECSNGLNFATGDLAIYGLRRGGLHDPWELALETVEHPTDTRPEHFFFGAWGPDNQLLYLDERDGSVHVASLASVRPVRSWPGFEEFLVAACDEHLRSFNEDGRRIGEATLPPGRAAEEPARERRALALAEGLDKSAERVTALLERVPGSVNAGDLTFALVEPAELGDAQLGYGVGPGGEDLTGGAGAWSPAWLVIGTEEDLGDPLFVELSSADLPVFTAAHGSGTWEPVEIAPRLDALVESAGR